MASHEKTSSHALLEDNQLGELRHWIQTLKDGYTLKDIRRLLHLNLYYKASVTGHVGIEDIELNNSLMCVAEEGFEWLEKEEL